MKLGTNHTKQHLSRRVILRALGASVALPWLESAAMGSRVANAHPSRFAFLFFGDGIHPPEWWTRAADRTSNSGPSFGRFRMSSRK